MRRGILGFIVATAGLASFCAPAGVALDGRVPVAEMRGGGSVQYASLLKRSSGPARKRHVLRLFTRNERDHVVSASRGGRSAVASYFGQNNGFEEWRIKRTDSGDANALIRKLIRRIRQDGRVRFTAFSNDPLFPGGAIAHTCKLRRYNELGACRIPF